MILPLSDLLRTARDTGTVKFRLLISPNDTDGRVLLLFGSFAIGYFFFLHVGTFYYSAGWRRARRAAPPFEYSKMAEYKLTALRRTQCPADDKGSNASRHLQV